MSHLQIVMQLPETRRTVFLYISSFLQELLSHTQDNELDAKTLGKVILIHITFICILLITLRGQNNNIGHSSLFCKLLAQFSCNLLQ